MGLPPQPAFVPLASSQETLPPPKRREEEKKPRVINYGVITPTYGREGQGKPGTIEAQKEEHKKNKEGQKGVKSPQLTLTKQAKVPNLVALSG